MTPLEELTRSFENAAVASAIIESLRDNDLEIKNDTIEDLNRGYTGARLVKALLAHVSGPESPRWCVIKYCPPESVGERRESRHHIAARRESNPEFRKRHLTKVAFPPIQGPQGALVVGQSVAEGEPLGRVEVGRLADVCKVIWEEMLREWVAPRYGSSLSTLADMVESELGGCLRNGGWLRDWAEERGLLEPAFLNLRGEKGPLPNPWRFFAEESSATREEIHCLTGPAHGDLHGDNVLVPVRDGQIHAAGFRLIDLTTYDARAPLSRDLATLLISLCWCEIGAGSARVQSAFLTYLERDHGDDRLNDVIPGDVRKIVDSLRGPAVRFAVRKNWDRARWHRQLNVSLLAQAMLHSTYTSGSEEARRWCSRLAGRLTRALLGPLERHPGSTMDFDAAASVGAPASSANHRPDQDGSVFVDRTGQRRRLRAVLEDDVTSVIVVSGPSGIGKTALVREVLAGLGRPDPDDETSALRWHDVARYGEIDVPTLVEDIEPPGLRRIAGPSARARLEIALDRLVEEAAGSRPVIVIDAAENLLGDSGILRDSELDLALEAVHDRLRSVVKIVFVTQQVPRATTGAAWPGTACRIGLEGLEPPSVREHFAKLDPGNRHGLAAVPDQALRTIHRCLAGNPRLAELLYGLLSSDRAALPPDEVGPWLSSVPTAEVHRRLTQRLVDHLPDDQRLAAKGLAALGIPIRSDALASVLEPYLPAARIEPALRALVAARLVLERRDGRRYLRKSELEAILEHTGRDGSPTREDLVTRAAEVLATMQKDDDDVHGMVDLDLHFAQIDVYLRAGMHDHAHDLIEDMAGLVRVWGSGAELRTQREAVRGRLEDDRQGEMMNLAALGEIYSSSGDLHAARAAYEPALAIAKQEHDREAIRRIYINMGSMLWQHDHLTEAEENFRWALALASEDDDDGGGDRAAAMIGLADCMQRHGHYQSAVDGAFDAYQAVWESDPELALIAAQRLTRWYAELDRLPEALTMLARYGELLLTHPDPRAQAELLTSTADMHLYADRYREARSAAGQAVTVAREHRLPIELGRSLTTLALAHLHLDELPAAHEAIEESARYRLPGRETVELVLRGAIAHRCGLRATARDLFRQLHEETGKRIDADRGDLAAWDFAGMARCHSVLLGEVEPEYALEAFATARREPAEPTPGLDDRLRFMVEILADGDPSLERVLEGLARIRPGRTSR